MDDELHYFRWKKHLEKTVGKDPDKIYRYLWDLYGSLLDEIFELQKTIRKQKFLNNGTIQDQNEQTSN